MNNCKNCFYYHEDYPTETMGYADYCGMYDRQTDAEDTCKSYRVAEHITILELKQENQQLKDRVDKLTNLLLKSRAMSSFPTAKWNEIRDELLTELKQERE